MISPNFGIALHRVWYVKNMIFLPVDCSIDSIVLGRLCSSKRSLIKRILLLNISIFMGIFN